MGHGEEEGARSLGGADGSMGRGRVRDSEAGGGGQGFSSHVDNGNWQTCGGWTFVSLQVFRAGVHSSGSTAILSSVTLRSDSSLFAVALWQCWV